MSSTQKRRPSHSLDDESARKKVHFTGPFCRNVPFNVTTWGDVDYEGLVSPLTHWKGEAKQHADLLAIKYWKTQTRQNNLFDVILGEAAMGKYDFSPLYRLIALQGLWYYHQSQFYPRFRFFLESDAQPFDRFQDHIYGIPEECWSAISTFCMNNDGFFYGQKIFIKPNQSSYTVKMVLTSQGHFPLARFPFPHEFICIKKDGPHKDRFRVPGTGIFSTIPISEQWQQRTSLIESIPDDNWVPGDEVAPSPTEVEDSDEDVCQIDENGLTVVDDTDPVHGPNKDRDWEAASFLISPDDELHDGDKEENYQRRFERHVESHETRRLARSRERRRRRKMMRQRDDFDGFEPDYYALIDSDLEYDSDTEIKLDCPPFSRASDLTVAAVAPILSNLSFISVNTSFGATDGSSFYNPSSFILETEVGMIRGECQEFAPEVMARWDKPENFQDAETTEGDTEDEGNIEEDAGEEGNIGNIEEKERDMTIAMCRR